MRLISKIMLLFWLLVGCAVLANQVQAGTNHIYRGGIVRDITPGEITVGTNHYTLAPAVRVLVINKRNGAYFEDKSSLSEIRAGQPVKIKVEATTVYEVLIERWKQ